MKYHIQHPYDRQESTTIDWILKVLLVLGTVFWVGLFISGIHWLVVNFEDLDDTVIVIEQSEAQACDVGESV